MGKMIDPPTTSTLFTGEVLDFGDIRYQYLIIRESGALLNKYRVSLITGNPGQGELLLTLVAEAESSDEARRCARQDYVERASLLVISPAPLPGL